MRKEVPSAKQVEEARELLSKYLRPTRLVRAESLERRADGQVYLKIESDLPSGSFKPRGALNALLTNAGQRTLAGVVAASTGTTVPPLLMRRASRTSPPQFFFRKILTR